MYDEGKYLTEVFKKKYENPNKCFKPSFLAVRSGHIAYLCKWSNKNLNIYTGLSTYKSEYYAMGAVESKKMEKAFEKYQKEKKSKSIESTTKKF